MGRVIGYVLRDVRTFGYVARTGAINHKGMTLIIEEAHIYPDADAAHAAKQLYQQVVELVAVDPPPLTRAQRVGRTASYIGVAIGMALIALGLWRLL